MGLQSRLQKGALALYTIISAINDGHEEQAVLDALLERTVVELGYRAATLRILDEERQTLALKAAYGLSEGYRAKGDVELASSAIDRAVIGGDLVTVDDVRADPGFQYGEAAEREGLVSAIALPLTLRDRAIGVLRVYTAAPHSFGEEERALLSAVASLGAQAIQRARLYTAFQQIARGMNSSLDLREVLTSLLLQSVDELNVRAGSIRLLGPSARTLHLAAAYGLSEGYLAKGAVKVAQSPVDQHVLAERQPVAITELTAAGGFQYPEEAQREGIRSVLVVPLCARGVPIGVLRVYSGQNRRFGAEEIAFMSTVADLGGLAIENAKLHEALKSRLAALQADANAWQRFLSFS
ncbi:GAF domain-containing protein [Oscillochloris sp. ZM17-4]|uniref:GAF domain-containing protein n=1 Tax=Oscillochloris sp. ZM17-4 TaxID=2866714 RepID=UPI001C729F7C|nr:GAF domain-containing protein [Oscillochloris sp. ZM17-4]MBX0327726.1 GAF domain-containing protein [Oscillochloris sp. ZM17-4]